ncbi:MAG: hypothetical protein EB127_15785 [Alphaproteobacteria bacterium]|nr:hypothetical protein [Alphaproteobacteria bacterium]
MPFYRNYKADDYFFDRHSIDTQLKFVFFPKRCWISGKYMWFTFAYRKVAMWTGPGEPIFEYRWYDKNEFLLLKLKQ